MTNSIQFKYSSPNEHGIREERDLSSEEKTSFDSIDRELRQNQQFIRIAKHLTYNPETIGYLIERDGSNYWVRLLENENDPGRRFFPEDDLMKILKRFSGREEPTQENPSPQAPPKAPENPKTPRENPTHTKKPVNLGNVFEGTSLDHSRLRGSSVDLDSENSDPETTFFPTRGFAPDPRDLISHLENLLVSQQNEINSLNGRLENLTEELARLIAVLNTRMTNHNIPPLREERVTLFSVPNPQQPTTTSQTTQTENAREPQESSTSTSSSPTDKAKALLKLLDKSPQGVLSQEEEERLDQDFEDIMNEEPQAKELTRKNEDPSFLASTEVLETLQKHHEEFQKKISDADSQRRELSTLLYSITEQEERSEVSLQDTSLSLNPDPSTNIPPPTQVKTGWDDWNSENMKKIEKLGFFFHSINDKNTVSRQLFQKNEIEFLALKKQFNESSPNPNELVKAIMNGVNELYEEARSIVYPTTHNTDTPQQPLDKIRPERESITAPLVKESITFPREYTEKTKQIINIFPLQVINYLKRDVSRFLTPPMNTSSQEEVLDRIALIADRIDLLLKNQDLSQLPFMKALHETTQKETNKNTPLSSILVCHLLCSYIVQNADASKSSAQDLITVLNASQTTSESGFSEKIAESLVLRHSTRRQTSSLLIKELLTLLPSKDDAYPTNVIEGQTKIQVPAKTKNPAQEESSAERGNLPTEQDFKEPSQNLAFQESPRENPHLLTTPTNQAGNQEKGSTNVSSKKKTTLTEFLGDRQSTEASANKEELEQTLFRVLDTLKESRRATEGFFGQQNLTTPPLLLTNPKPTDEKEDFPSAPLPANTIITESPVTTEAPSNSATPPSKKERQQRNRASKAKVRTLLDPPT